MRVRHAVIATFAVGLIACGVLIGIDDRSLDTDAGAVDDAGDAALDTATPDTSADVDAATDGSSCPAACTSCTDNRCLIDCPSDKCKSPVVCPAGMACRVTCNGDAGKACENFTIDCSKAKSCRVDCNGVKDTCNDMKIISSPAPLCITCKGATAACDQVACTADAGCTRICNGGVGGACTTNTCPTACTGGSACP